MVEEPAEVTEEPSSLASESTETDGTQEQTIGEQAVPFATESDGTEETSEPIAEETSPAETDDEQESVEDFLDNTEKKDPMQKRIDQLVARAKSAEERLQAAEAKLETPKSDKQEFTKTQLKTAMKKAWEDGDPDLMMDIMDYRVEQVKTSLRKEYEDEQKKYVEQAKSRNNEWTNVVESYGYLSAPDEPEIYEGARTELDLKNAQSLLYQVATYFFNNPDEKTRQYYQQPGGQKLAVADALTQILRKRRGLAPKDKEKDKLKRALAKEKRKKSLSGGSPGKETDTTPKRPKSAKESMDEYMRERLEARANPLKAMGRT